MYKEDWQRVAKECQDAIDHSKQVIEINEVMRDSAKSMVDMAKGRPNLPKEKNNMTG